MPTYNTVLTNTGAAKVAAAIAASTTVPLQSIALGDGNGSAVTPVATQTALVHEVYRQNLNSLKQDPSFANTFIAEIVVPANVGGFTVREIGLFDTAGALIAVGSFPETVKPVSGEGSTQTLVVKMYVQVSSASAVSLTIDPSTVVATRNWVIDLLYPVGEVLITHRSANPSTWIGGTWTRYGAGKMLAFYNSSESEFNALDKTGGAKTHTLVKANLPNIQLSVTANGTAAAAGSHTHTVSATGNTNTTGSHTHWPAGQHRYTREANSGSGQTYGSGATYTLPAASLTAAGDHTHTVSVNGTAASDGSHTHTVSVTGTTEALGSGQSVNHLPPYTTLFAWLRTA